MKKRKITERGEFPQAHGPEGGHTGKKSNTFSKEKQRAGRKE